MMGGEAVKGQISSLTSIRIVGFALTDASDDLKKRLTEHIKKTGYPLEIQIAQQLSEFSWVGSTNTPYIDPDEKKQREVDIYAINVPFLEQQTSNISKSVPLIPLILVECKKSNDSSLVLFPKREPFSFFMIGGQTIDFPALIGNKTVTLKGPFGLGAAGFLAQCLHYNGRPVSSTYTLTKPGGKSKSDIFEAVNILMKAQVTRLDEVRPGEKPSTYPMIFTFLAIAFDGSMFEATVTEGDIALNEVTHGLIHSLNWSPLHDSPVNYVIDVVRQDHFKQYLELLRNDIQTVRQKGKEFEQDAIAYFGT